MAERKVLKPGKDGLVVRDPVSMRPLKAEGEEKEITTYWTRRIMCGDAIVVEPAKPEEKVSKT